MFLFLSKILDLLLEPLTWALVSLAWAAIVMGSRPRQARALVAFALLVLVVFSLEPVSRRLWRALEEGATRTFRPDPPYDAVIVLGGMTDAAASRVSGGPELTESADRLVEVAAIIRSGQARMVLLSGGILSPGPGEPSEAERLVPLLERLGVPRERVVVEPRSRNTRENALESAQVVAHHGWTRLLLITSAGHMPRALGCFRAVGLEPDTLPVDHRVGDDRSPWPYRMLPRAEQLHASADAIRELVGRVVYRAAGYTR